MAFILIQTTSCADFERYCEQAQEVVDLYNISGQHNFLIKVPTPTMEALGRFSNQLGAFGHSTTLVVLEIGFETKRIVPNVSE